MRTTRTRLTALLLTLLMLLPSLAACSKKPADNSSSQPGKTDVSGERNDVPQNLDFKNADFSIIARYLCEDIDTEEMNGEGVNDALYTRNRKAEDRLKIKIRTANFTDTVDEMKNIILSGTDGYAAVHEDMPTMANYMQSGYFYSLTSVPYVDTDKPYWTQGVIDELTVCDKTFLLAGDLSILNNCNIWCLFFNKDMLNDLQLESPYDALNEGRWTLDFFERSATAAALDMDNDGQWNYATDRFASTGMRQCFCGMYNAMGQLTYLRDDDGHFVYNAESEASVNALMAITEWANKGFRKYYMTVDAIGPSSETESWEKAGLCWVENRCLYEHADCSGVYSETTRSLDFDFGILPLPKLNEKQADYVSSPCEWASCVYAVPICSPNVDMSGAVLEVLSDYSTDTIRHAFYEVAIHRKYTRDVESIASLDILFDKMIIDPGFVFGFVGTTPYRNIIRAGVMDNRIVTQMAKYQKAIQKSMTAYEEAIEKISY